MSDGPYSEINLLSGVAIGDIATASNIAITGIVHVGANTGQELKTYSELTHGPIVMIEPIDSIFAVLKNRCAANAKAVPIQAVCSDAAGAEVTFNISSNNGLSSSFLGLGQHAEIYPSVTYQDSVKMTTTTLDDIRASHKNDFDQINYMIVDTQGADLKVLKGSGKTLETISVIQVEVSTSPLYEGGCTADEIKAYLDEHGFTLELQQVKKRGQGEALYVKRSAG